ncbi:MAG: hypothetical protein JWM27_3215 [Gemmatimonadetes bacterium]|nr:hypothetical protein [Gemmatimonadota bacterium]
MKKLTLTALEVTSFETLAPVTETRGTVHGNALTTPIQCGPTTPAMDCTLAPSCFRNCIPYP